MVKLQTKLLSSVPDDTKIPSKNQARTFSWTTTTPSVDHWVQQMLAAGWVDTTATTTKICSSCRDDKTRQGFARRQWRCSSPKCKSCTLHRADQDRRDTTRRLEVAIADFVPPAARPQPTMERTEELSTENRRRSSSLQSSLCTRKYGGRHGLPNSGWVKKDEQVKSYRVMPGEALQIYAGPGGRNQKMGHLRSKDVVTEFAASKGWGCWIRISCELHPAEWVARIVRIDADRLPEKENTKEVLVALQMDAVPKDLLCSHAGCTARPCTMTRQAVWS